MSRLVKELCHRFDGIYTRATSPVRWSPDDPNDWSSAVPNVSARSSAVADQVIERLPRLVMVGDEWESLLDGLEGERLATNWRGPVVIDNAFSIISMSGGLRREINHTRRSRTALSLIYTSHLHVTNPNLVELEREGRVIEVPPLGAGLVTKVCPELEPAEQVVFYSAWGGIPHYWQLAAPFGKDFGRAVEALVLDPDGPLHEEPDYLLRHEAPSALPSLAVVETMGAGAHWLPEIGMRLGTHRGVWTTDDLGHSLSSLSGSRFVREETPFGSPTEAADGRTYRICDPFLRLWLRLVAPRRTVIRTMKREDRRALWERAAAALTAETWKDLCREAVPRLHLTDSPLAALGPWKAPRRYRGRVGPIVDLVALSEDGRRVLVGEARWRTTPRSRRAREQVANQIPGVRDLEVVHATFVPEGRRQSGDRGAHVVDAETVLAALSARESEVRHGGEDRLASVSVDLTGTRSREAADGSPASTKVGRGGEVVVNADDSFSAVPPGHLRCFITGELRPRTARERVRQGVARSLVEDYGYRRPQVDIDVTLHFGDLETQVDLAVYRYGTERTQDDIFLLIDTRAEDCEPAEDEVGRERLKKYLIGVSRFPYCLWVGRERRAFGIGDERLDEIPDIPPAGHEPAAAYSAAQLMTPREVSPVFRRIERYIAGTGLTTTRASRELRKVILCKIYQERHGAFHIAVGPIWFSWDPRKQHDPAGRRRSPLARLRFLFGKARDKFPFIFREDERIDLDSAAAAYAILELQHLSLTREATSRVRRETYDELAGALLPGSPAAQATPRGVSDLAVRMVMALLHERKLASLRVLDCFCGTGEFLVSWMDNVDAALFREIGDRWRVERRVRKIGRRRLFGLEVDRDLVQACRLNLEMHDAEPSNVLCTDFLRQPESWCRKGKARKVFPYGPYGHLDVVFTNPPFGQRARVGEMRDRKVYEFPGPDDVQAGVIAPAECVYLDTLLRFVRSGGYLAAVLPRGILDRRSYRHYRLPLLSRSRLIACVDLPETTFAANGRVGAASLLVLQRGNIFPQPQMRDDEVFEARPRTSGVDRFGKPIYARSPDGKERLGHDGEPILDDEVSAVAGTFREWVRRGGPRER